MLMRLLGEKIGLSKSSCCHPTLKYPTELEMTLSAFSCLVCVYWISGPTLSNFIFFRGGWKLGDFGLNRWKKLKMED